ncbi:kinesin-like protein nack1 [Phtheirospermum japonicum]|uniref:Kinesin-like protein n=1 Tax=Phtheirospermum japonicum TaxID=374723 RepID=A0A830B840_9LAMI|nr:kinesin-like protein nack1 [Phtheirospermum japonicum]
MESGEEYDERIYVSVRLRPLNEKEIMRNDVSDWECINDKTIVYKNAGLSASERSMYPTAYTFDRVFRTDCSTRDVYEKGAKDVAISVVNGMNSSVFAYGQTSSGKTYTMTGITEYAIADIYEYIEKHPERDFVLKFSAMEIYNESVRDLLSLDSTPLRLLDDPERGTIVEKLTEEILKDWNHVIHLLSICEAQRQIGETSLNEMSSRSHQIIRLTIESSSCEFLGRDNASTLAATVNFVDLAGSERASQSLSAGTSCAKEVTTNARVNVVMSDKALVKYLQRELARMQSELRSPRSTFSPTDYSTVVREKDRQIEKLEEEINDLILQRDIAQSQVKDLLRMLGDDANSTPQVGYGDYPHVGVHKSPKKEIQTSIFPDLHSLDVDTRAFSGGHSPTSSTGHIVKVPYFDENFAHSNTSPRILTSNSSERYSYHGWEEIDKQSNGIPEDLCREVRCIETVESSETGTTEFNNPLFPDVEVYENGHGRKLESPFSATLEKDQVFKTTPSNNDNEIREERGKEPLSSTPCDQKKEKENSSTRFLNVPSLENRSSTQSFILTRSRSCKASITDSCSPWLKTIDFSESRSESVGNEKKLSPLSFKSDAQSLLRKDSRDSPRYALDIEIDSPNVKFLNAEDVVSSTNDTMDMTEISIEHSKEIEQKVDEFPKKNVKDVGLDPIEVEPKDHSNWPCDPSDAIYLEVEVRRMKFLKQKFVQGDKTTVNGKCLTLESSAKALREERRTLSHRMTKKLSELERESLFLKWGIGLNTKLRRLQLAHRLWTKTDDMDHIADSAFLVAKLFDTVEPGQTHNKEISVYIVVHVYCIV